MDKRGVGTNDFVEFVGSAMQEDERVVVGPSPYVEARQRILFFAATEAHTALNGRLGRIATALMAFEWPVISPTLEPLQIDQSVSLGEELALHNLRIKCEGMPEPQRPVSTMEKARLQQTYLSLPSPTAINLLDSPSHWRSLIRPAMGRVSFLRICSVPARSQTRTRPDASALATK